MRRLLYIMMIPLLGACYSIDCPLNSIVATRYELCDSSGESFSIGDTLTVTSNRIDGQETTLLNCAVGISSFQLPISYSHPEDILVFRFDNDQRSFHIMDTVWVKKNDIPHFESVDCNASFFHEITDVRHTCTVIDSIVIKNPSVTYDTTVVNFNVYLKTKTD